jgi:hypothetical protein
MNAFEIALIEFNLPFAGLLKQYGATTDAKTLSASDGSTEDSEYKRIYKKTT